MCIRPCSRLRGNFLSAYEEFEDSEGGVLFLWLMF